MTHQDTGRPERPGPTTAQLRGDIQSGRTGDKVAGFDPAAAPLGADDEAAGTPPGPAEVAQARAQEGKGARAERRPNASSPELQPDARTDRPPGVAMGAVIGVGAAALVAALIAAAL